MAQYETFIVVWAFVIMETQAQCTIQHFDVSPDPSSPSTHLSVSWQCDASNNEFAITYQLTNRDQCDTGDGSLQDPFHTHTPRGWDSWDDVEMRIGDGPYAYSSTLFDLLPYSTYTVSIQSRTGVGNPSYGGTQSTTVTTGEAAPSQGPIVRIYAKFSTYLELWFAQVQCGRRHGLITGYEYELTTPNEDHTQSLPVPEAVFTEMTFDGFPGVRVTGLSCGIQYTLHVKAKNNAGTGPRFGITIFTKTDPSGSVQNLLPASVSSSQLTVTWREASNKGCPEVDTYEVMYEGITRHQDECQNDFTLHTFMDTTNGLSNIFDVRPFYSYNITVKATGGSDVTIAELTPGSASSVSPRNVRTTSSSDTTRTISWDEIPCSARNGIIEGYPYGLTLLSASGNAVVDNGEVVTTSVTVSLGASGTYLFSVAGRTALGNGPNAYKTLVITITDPVSTVTTVVPETITSTQPDMTPTSLISSRLYGRSEATTTATIPIDATTDINKKTDGMDSLGQNSNNETVTVALTACVVLLIVAIITNIVLGLLWQRTRNRFKKYKADAQNFGNRDTNARDTTTRVSNNMMNTAYQPDDEGYENPPAAPGASHQARCSTEYEVTLPERLRQEQPYQDLDAKTSEKDHQYQELAHGRNVRK